MNKVLKINTAFWFLGFLSICFFSCESHVQEEEFGEVEQVLCDPSISFANVIQPIIDANCVQCHGGSQAPNLSTFSGVSRNANSVKDEIESRRMPLGGSLTNEQIQQISCWVANGALNN